ncbi:uncharacterized protein LOC124910116 [Impatiens glandulifera]|uniref:uncharacterized protein LOC124910116 n=1 Tax=Impatiens glandulifera TaxID=253017 RepID=UPI001FB0FD1B|nr:uncharacterized protein LOC124910116 [Impatiens glandulifera]
MVVGESLDWLPSGWTKHVKLCNNRKIKSISSSDVLFLESSSHFSSSVSSFDCCCLTILVNLLQSYIEPVTNRKFYSKPEVLRYLKHDSSTSKPNATAEDDDDLYELEKLDDDYSQCNAYEKPDWLPHGWTMVLTPPRTSLLNSKTQKVT